MELSDGDFPLEFTHTNFEGHYASLQLIGMGPPSVPAGAINGVTFDTVFILQFITREPFIYKAHRTFADWVRIQYAPRGIFYS